MDEEQDNKKETGNESEAEGPGVFTDKPAHMRNH